MQRSGKLTRIHYLGYSAMVLFGIVMVLQLLLAAGILPISMAWGGRHTELTLTLRLSGLIAIILLCYFAYMIARRSGIMGNSPPSALINLMSWFVTAYLVFNTVVIFLSTSQIEKWVFGPLTLALLIITLIINLMEYTSEGQ
jgi:hypothetical protein